MAATYARKIVGDDKIKEALKRLDRLTKEEFHTAVVQTLSVAHNLDDKMRKLMEGMQSFVGWSLAYC